MSPRTLILSCLLALSPALARAELKLPTVIGDHMVLQQKQSNPIWGWDTPGTKVSVTFSGKTYDAVAGKDGRWEVKLDPQHANSTPQKMSVKGSTAKEIQDILIGEVWMCSGQSNMGFTVAGDWKGDLEALASKHPNLRLFALPMVGTQELKTDIDAKWESSNADTAKPFTAVGFFFGRYLHEVLGVPVGLIDNAWGGSSAEAWVRRTTLESDPRFKDLMTRWQDTEKNYNFDKVKADFEAQMAEWKEKAAAAKAAGKQPPNQPRAPQNQMTGQHRPGNIFAGMMHPTLGYGIKGVIWYQGESNAGRAWEYRELFPFMISQWRKEWKQGDFPFYWVQLADFMAEKPEPGDSAWAELREAQTLTQKLPNTGQAVIIDLGEANDIHPKNKYDVAARLVRWALAKDYGIKIAYRSPELKSYEVVGGKIVLTLDCFGSGLRTLDVAELKGFAISGEDKKWVPAQAKIVGNDKIEVWSAQVPAPKAARYAWADNPVVNVLSRDGLPVTPFRTDDYEMVTKPKPVPAPAAAAVKPAPAPAPAPAKPVKGVESVVNGKVNPTGQTQASAQAPDKDGFVSIFDGKTLKGWHVSAKSGHSRTTKNTSGGKWEVVDGAITGTQDVPGNGGLVLTDAQYSEFEVIVEMNNDFGPDSGLFLRSTEDGKCYQGLIDFHGAGSLMGLYGEGLGGKPHFRFFNFGETESDIELTPDRTPPGPDGKPQKVNMTPEQWKTFWKKDGWNEFKMRITGGDKPTITTWINGMKIMEWTETEARLPAKGSIGLQVHGGGDWTKHFVRYRNIRVKDLSKK